jgi:hypothetical protein
VGYDFHCAWFAIEVIFKFAAVASRRGNQPGVGFIFHVLAIGAATAIMGFAEA